MKLYCYIFVLMCRWDNILLCGIRRVGNTMIVKVSFHCLLFVFMVYKMLIILQ